MPQNLINLGAWCDEIGPRVKAANNELKKQAALAFAQNITQATPVDTGTAVSNWQTTLETPATDVIPAYFPAPKSTYGRHKEGGFAQHSAENAEAAMQAARDTVSGANYGTPVYIANNVPYMERLEVVGTSSQADPGFFDRALVESVATMDRAKLEP